MIPFVTETLGWRFLLAFVLSVALWARLTLDQNPERRDVYPSEIPVEVRGLATNLVVANEIQPIKVRISAPRESWTRLSVASFRAVVDLSNATAGLAQPEVQVEVSDPEVRVLERIPSRVTVRIEELRTRTVPVRIEQLGSLPFGYRLVGEPAAAPPAVQVSGPGSAVEKVSEAAVAVRMDEIKATIDRTLKPEPRGPGGVVTGVRLEPQSVVVTIPVEQIAASKTVSVVPQIRGQPAPGYWQGPISIDPSSVQIVGDPNVLEGVSLLTTAEVDVTGAQADVVRTVPIQRGPGVTIVRDTAATVRVAILPLQGQQVRDVAVTVDGLDGGLRASATPPTVSVTISGPQPLLQRLGPPDVAAAVDATGLGAGDHSLPVSVRAPDGVRVDRIFPDRVAVSLRPAA
jgi:YbbR domain-containing protein